ncbi:MAG TPA: mRNA surveillance protein pelota [Alphaproteobacteria bacterium]|nr:mRNA surveillance protein pelota [Alphaproteobacteria bacterium]
MKIVHKDLKHGEIKVYVDNVQDLWQLSNIVEEGDFVSGTTERKIKLGGTDEKAKIIKRIVFLKIVVEKIEHDHTLRLSGKIIDAPDDIPRGDYHTFDVNIGVTITIEKENWTKYSLKKLDESVNTQMTEVLIVAFDREEAIFAVLKRQGYEVLLHLKGDVSKKDVEEKKTNFYAEIYKQLLDYDQKYYFENIVVASPAFWKEYLIKEIKNDALKKKIVLATCSSVDESSINEIIKRPELKTVLDKNKATSELKILEEVLGKINKNEAVYGLRDVNEKIASGNVNQVLVSENLILRMRTDKKYALIEEAMTNAENAGGELKIISSDEAMKKLDGITGIAAILRWKEDYS